MRKRRPVSEEELLKPLTIPFMIRYLWQIGYIGRKDDKSIIVSLRDMSLRITMRKMNSQRLCHSPLRTWIMMWS